VQSKLIQERTGERTWALVFETGEEAMNGLREFARAANLIGSRFTAIGAFSDVTLGFFDPEKKEYVKIPVREQVEVLSLLGNVAQHEGKPKVHAHIVVGKRTGAAHGGHLLEAHVRPTLEVIVVESPSHLERHTDDRTGLALLKTG
jgi:predicted DNA-binding protein with PD1-like motif